MSGVEVRVVGTGIANIASVMAGLHRVGARAVLTEDGAEISAAERIFLPGVGAFGAGVSRLRELGLVEPLRERIEAGRPTLAICLGLQLLCEESEETPGVAGLGLVPGVVRRFPEGVVVPHFGWNQISPSADCRLLQPGYAYYANSYRLAEAPPGWACAFSDHGGPFVAAMERGAVLACQFHPELSSGWGLDLMARWLAL